MIAPGEDAGYAPSRRVLLHIVMGTGARGWISFHVLCFIVLFCEGFQRLLTREAPADPKRA